MCPVLCSGHGEYRDGECVCRPGWKGRECSIRHDECEVPDCNSHGHCVDGHCRCAKGYKGEFCEEGKRDRFSLFSLLLILPLFFSVKQFFFYEFV